MPSIAVFSPAKINLFLAVTGRRPDGYHDLVSVVAPVTHGDSLWLHVDAAAGPVTLSCPQPGVPTGAENLAVRAAEAWRQAAGVGVAIHIELTKRIPMGAGLGGGSSNAVAVLRGLNSLPIGRLDGRLLATVAAGLGSDCPLFLAEGPCVMRGRGERLEPLPKGARGRLTGRRILIFKADFSISTPWAYGCLAADPAKHYDPAEAVEARLARWIAGEEAVGSLLFNSFERVAFRKFLALPLVLDKLRDLPGVDGVLMSGSGSACFVLLGEHASTARIRACLVETLGPAVWIAEAAVC